jgi:hypothetical protein
MNEPFIVQVTSPDIPVANDRQVVFHGINKSGSLAMADVIVQAYHDAGRANDVFSVYHGIPHEMDRFTPIVENSSGHGFFISHYLFGAVDLGATGLWLTQVRHPLQRTLSVHGWLKRGWEKKHGNVDEFPGLRDWVLWTCGRRETQMAQLAVGFGDGYRQRVLHMATEEMREVALERLERDVAWFGVAELFEESIFSLAHLCGLPAVRPWERDTRNRWRESLADVDEDTISLIYETLAEEFAFYEGALALFRSRIESADFGPSFDSYKARCSSEYEAV